MKRLNVALIGCGVISDNHLIPITESEKVNLVAICDIEKGRAESKIKQHSLNARVYTSYIEMLDNERVDVIHIATPHHLHCEMTIAALKRGINVFLEKPMCISTDEIERMLEAERESTAKVCVCFQNRFNPSTLYAERVCKEDGGAICGFGSLFWKRDAEYYAQDSWRGKWATEGGGVMINQAIHTIDLLHYFLGKPEFVCATMSNHSLKKEIEVEDTCEGIIYFENGKRANFYATNSYVSLDYNTLVIETQNHTIEIRRDHLYVDGIRIDDEDNNIPYMGKACYGNGHRQLIERFYDSVINNAPSPVTMESAQYALRILLAAYKSNDEKIKV